jgi:hypothetical protein
MADILHHRARRFHALYQLLIGAAHAELPSPNDELDHLRKEEGLPKQVLRRLTTNHFKNSRTFTIRRSS